jgi:hypothetical protein
VTVIGTQTIIVTPPSGPGGPPGATGSPSRTPSRSAPRTFTHLGNTISAECLRGTQAHIRRAVPAPGYQVRTNLGPAPRATAVFLSATIRITMTVTCSGGTPEAEIVETPAS